MSENTPFRIQLKHHLKKLPVAAFLWRYLYKKWRVARYYTLRIVGRATYPLLGPRAPLIGYFWKTRDFMRNGYGKYIEFDQPWWTDNAASPNALKTEIFVAIIPKARCLYHNGVVVSPGHRLLADVSWLRGHCKPRPLRDPVMYDLMLPPIQHIDGRVAVISSLQHDNYYHWMFQILPRFEVLQRYGIDPDYYVVNTNTPFQKESLQILHISEDRILNPTNSTHIEADELIVPSLLEFSDITSPQSRACHYLRSKFLQKNLPKRSDRALYITRDDANVRRVLNEQEIREELIDNGFEVVSLSSFTLRQQVEMFSEARIIVAPHGAGLTNAVFCEKGSVLIEFMPKGWVVPNYFHRLARIVGMEYYRIVGSKAGRHDDYTVNRAVLRKVLADLYR
jgi:hypothetical protein